MPKCIFCKLTTGPFTTREHILPESLGGGDWAILPSGLLCDECQNRFGSSIEQQALIDYPFSFFRVFLGIPTTYYEPFVNGSGLKRGEYPRVIARIGG